MNNTDLINQMNLMNQNNANNAAIYYMTECSNVPLTDTDIYIFIGAIGFTVLFGIFTIWYSFKD